MNYRSIADLNAEVKRLSSKVDDYDLIAGIPRSGLLAANMLALYLDLPLTDIEGICEGRILQTGRRYDENISSLQDVDKVLVLDDSVSTGTQMQETSKRLDGIDFEFEIEYAAVYITKHGHKYVDHWGEVVNNPRIFEWNLMHSSVLNNACVDIDGVLCRDPNEKENDDGDNYKQFLNNVDSNIIPSEKIGWIVTCRLEKYRDETENWLEQVGIEYDELIMMDLPNKKTRNRLGNHAEYKSNVYEKTNADLFIESSRSQASEIAENTGRPVYCFEDDVMIGHNPTSKSYIKYKSQSKLREFSHYLNRFINSPLSFSRSALSYIFTKCKRKYYRLKFYITN